MSKELNIGDLFWIKGASGNDKGFFIVTGIRELTMYNGTKKSAIECKLFAHENGYRPSSISKLKTRTYLTHRIEKITPEIILEYKKYNMENIEKHWDGIFKGLFPGYIEEKSEDKSEEDFIKTLGGAGLLRRED